MSRRAAGQLRAPSPICNVMTEEESWPCGELVRVAGHHIHGPRQRLY